MRCCPESGLRGVVSYPLEKMGDGGGVGQSKVLLYIALLFFKSFVFLYITFVTMLKNRFNCLGCTAHGMLFMN